jgi:hypothetical protein
MMMMMMQEPELEWNLYWNLGKCSTGDWDWENDWAMSLMLEEMRKSWMKSYLSWEEETNMR